MAKRNVPETTGDSRPLTDADVRRLCVRRWVELDKAYADSVTDVKVTNRRLQIMAVETLLRGHAYLPLVSPNVELTALPGIRDLLERFSAVPATVPSSLFTSGSLVSTW